MTRLGRAPSRRTFLGSLAGAVAAPAVLAERLVGFAPPELSLPPLLARPTASSILIHARNGQTEASARVEVRTSQSGKRVSQSQARHVAPGAFLEWPIAGLAPGTRYQYQIRLKGAVGHEIVAAQGGFVTQRSRDDSFIAALITDPHTGTFTEGSSPLQVMDDVVRNVGRDNPDLVIGLGDNVAWSTSRDEVQRTADEAEQAYATYRRHLGPLTAYTSHFSAIGNWEGETGKFPQASIDLVRGVRRRFLPNPNQQTYPEGGSAEEDYYAFTWGSVLFVVLNVQGYTTALAPLAQATSADVARVEDWTLGPAQLTWLGDTLQKSNAPFKCLCIHHAVGGNAGNDGDTLYGRGGARAAGVGEQRIVHQLMRDSGVQIFFYGHDHVFVDDVVDGIHYALPGSFGAPWHFQAQTTGYARSWPDSGHARLTVDPREARVEFVNQAGVVFHAFTVEPR